MKKIFIIAAAALATLASCTKVENEMPQKEISFEAINYKNNKETKAAINSAAYPTDLPFGVFAYYLQTGTWETNGTTSSPFMNGVECTYTRTYATQNYAPEQKYYWPLEGSLSFIAYSPFADVTASYDQSTKTLKISDFSLSTTIADQKDLMYSRASDASNKSDNEIEYNNGTEKGVKIQFRHALSQLRFSAKASSNVDAATTYFKINNITIKNAENKGTLNIIDDAISGNNGEGWTMTTNNKTNFVALNVDKADAVKLTNEYVEKGDNVLVIPQTLADDFVVSVNYTMYNAANVDLGSKTVDVKLNQTNGISAIAPNKIYNIQLIIDADVIRFSPEIVNWDTEVVSKEYDVPANTVHSNS